MLLKNAYFLKASLNKYEWLNLMFSAYKENLLFYNVMIWGYIILKFYIWIALLSDHEALLLSMAWKFIKRCT